MPQARPASIAVRLLAATAVSLTLLAGCDAGAEEPKATVTPNTAVLTPPGRSEAPDQPTLLEQLKAQEYVRSATIIAEQSGTGPTDAAFLQADGSYALRAMCSGGGTLHVTMGGADDRLPVTCDGTSTGIRFRSDGSASTVLWSIDAGPAQRWALVWFEPTLD